MALILFGINFRTASFLHFWWQSQPLLWHPAHVPVYYVSGLVPIGNYH